ncbi:MAG: hypothetical protein RIF36_05305 [Imperialibacter sp.]|uniref:hypothetical protein n=1 Tax=Imperialibacter sp. TaxID=2038411 RepID=UPI0032EA8FDC
MAKQETDPLFQLIKSLTKAEKRNFKLYAKRINGKEDSKFITLFDVMDDVDVYDEKVILKKAPSLIPQQLSNLKSHLYGQVLKSLRLIHINYDYPIEVREQIDYARVLYNKGLYKQSLRILDKLKQKAAENNEEILQLEIIDFEKLIEGQYITRSIGNRAEELVNESRHVTKIIAKTQELSNLSISLYSLYIKLGYVRNEEDYRVVQHYFKRNLPDYEYDSLSFNEKVYLCQSMVWYYYIVQDFVKCYRYADRWVELFKSHPAMIKRKPDLYIKGLHNLLAALFNIQHYPKFAENLLVLEELKNSTLFSQNENIQSLLSFYYYNDKINLFFMEGRFTEGLVIVPDVLEIIDKFDNKIDSHRVLLFYYKIACLYFGSDDNKNAVKYLNKIINLKDVSLREDIHCFARILNLIAHYEMGNSDLLEYQIKSVYRFLVKMDNLQGVQKEIIKWLRKVPGMLPENIKKEFQALKERLEETLKEPFELRAFLYLDIISWLESKIDGVPVQVVIRRKFDERNR